MSDNINVYGNLNIDILGDLTLPFANHIFDIDEVLAFFDAYHSTWGNLLIHLVASPVIPWTLLVWASSLGGRTLALGLAGLFLVYYCSLHLAYGLSFAPLFLLLTLHAISFAEAKRGANKTALVVHSLSWLCQVIGHESIERRKSALKDTLLQAVVQAPFLLYIEVLFKLGWDKARGDRVAQLAKSMYPRT